MKKSFLSLLMMALLSFSNAEAQLTDAERNMASEEMTKTSDHLQTVLKNLTQEQLDFKTSKEAWSIAECTEHIAISENMIFGMLQGTLKSKPDASKRSDVKILDDQLLAMIVDRSTKVKTQEPFEPTGKFGSQQETLNEFLTKRKAHIQYVMQTNDDLRNHYQQLPFGTIDAFQILLFMSAHTERHIKQIKEIMNTDGYPRL